MAICRGFVPGDIPYHWSPVRWQGLKPSKSSTYAIVICLSQKRYHERAGVSKKSTLGNGI